MTTVRTISKLTRLGELLGISADTMSTMIAEDELGEDSVRRRVVRQAWNLSMIDLQTLTPDQLHEVQRLRNELGPP